MIIDDINKKGWTKFVQKNSNYELENLSNYINILEKKFRQELEKRKDSNISIEIFKSTLRSLVKISPESNNFLLQIAKKFVSENKKFEEYYVSYPYLLFHLPNDMEETGTLHTDTIKECGYSFTCWSPVNNYQLNYSPLTIIERTNNIFDLYLLKIFRKIFNHNKIFKIYYKNFKNIINLTPKLFESYIWDADTIHVGNLNKGTKAHYAMTTKISEKPHLTEPSIKIKDFITSQNLSDTVHEISYEELFSTINKINNLILIFYKKNSITKNSDLLIDQLLEIKKTITTVDLINCISFAFSLIGYKQKDLKLALLQYFTSVFFLPKYLSSYHQVIMISNKESNFSYLEYLKKSSNLNEVFQKNFIEKYKKHLV